MYPEIPGLSGGFCPWQGLPRQILGEGTMKDLKKMKGPVYSARDRVTGVALLARLWRRILRDRVFCGFTTYRIPHEEWVQSVLGGSKRQEAGRFNPWFLRWMIGTFSIIIYIYLTGSETCGIWIFHFLTGTQQTLTAEPWTTFCCFEQTGKILSSKRHSN